MGLLICTSTPTSSPATAVLCCWSTILDFVPPSSQETKLLSEPASLKAESHANKCTHRWQNTWQSCKVACCFLSTCDSESLWQYKMASHSTGLLVQIRVRRLIARWHVGHVKATTVHTVCNTRPGEAECLKDCRVYHHISTQLNSTQLNPTQLT